MTSACFDASRQPRKPFSGRVLLHHHDDLERVELGARLNELGWSVRFVACVTELVDTALRSAPTLVLVGLDDAGELGAQAVAQLRARGHAGLVIGLARDPWPLIEARGRRFGCDDVLDVAVPLLELKLRVRPWLERRAALADDPRIANAPGPGRWQQLWQRVRGRRPAAAA